MPTETDDNSKSLLLAGLGRQCMCFWTILRSVIYQIPAGGTKTKLKHGNLLFFKDGIDYTSIPVRKKCQFNVSMEIRKDAIFDRLKIK
jgi:hypothetical protein